MGRSASATSWAVASTLSTPARPVAYGRRCAAALAVLACSLGALGCAGDGEDGGKTRSPGPLRGLDVSRVIVPQPAGKPFVFGLPIVVNTGTETARFERIGVANAPAGIKVLKTFVIGPERRTAIAYDFHWPSRTHHFDAVAPVRGYRLAPRSAGKARLGVQLVYVIRIDKPGTYAFDAVTVDYGVGGQAHRATIRNGLRACIFPKGVKPDIDHCPKGST
jgi:hypothetical protein